MTRIYLKTFPIVLALILNACAFDISHVKQIPTQLQTPKMAKSSFMLTKEVHLRTQYNYHRALKANTRWEFVGTISQGDVYKTRDQVLTVEASNIYEAYLVLSGNRVVGFYLPVEKTFNPLEEVQDLAIKTIN